DKGYVAIGSLTANLSAFCQRKPDSTYLLSVGQIDISSTGEYLHAKDINVVPLQNRPEDDIRQNNIYEVYVPDFHLDDIDIKHLYDTRSLKIPQVKVSSAAIKLMGYNLEDSARSNLQEVNLDRKSVV